jgi:hypothetical protein
MRNIHRDDRTADDHLPQMNTINLQGEINLSQSYRDILKRQEGTAFSSPRDAKVWDLLKSKFTDNLALIRDFA